MADPIAEFTPSVNVVSNEENDSPTSCSNVIPASVKSQLRDALYDTLEQHFFKTGQGRRKALPDLVLVTEKLLLQLFCLKTQHSASWSEVFSWFQKLFPGLSVSSERLAYFIEKAALKV